MALTRHSVRNCFLWQDRAGDLGADTIAGKLWTPFLPCLRDLEDRPSNGEDGEAGNGAASPGVQRSLAGFLRQLLAAGDAAAAGELRRKLEEQQQPLAALAAWRREDEDGRDAPRRLFDQPRDQ